MLALATSISQSPARTRYLQEPSRGMVDLKSRVVQLEVCRQHPLDSQSSGMAVSALADQDMCAQQRVAGNDLPDVQVVHLDHVRDGDHCRPYELRGQPRRS